MTIDFIDDRDRLEAFTAKINLLRAVFAFALFLIIIFFVFFSWKSVAVNEDQHQGKVENVSDQNKLDQEKKNDDQEKKVKKTENSKEKNVK